MYIHQLKNTTLLTIANHYLSLNLFADSNIKDWGSPGGASGKEPAYQCRRLKRCRFDPWFREIPWRRAWQPTLVFLPGESPWTEEPGRLQSIGLQRIRHNWATKHKNVNGVKNYHFLLEDLACEAGQNWQQTIWFQHLMLDLSLIPSSSHLLPNCLSKSPCFGECAWLALKALVVILVHVLPFLPPRYTS